MCTTTLVCTATYSSPYVHLYSPMYISASLVPRPSFFLLESNNLTSIQGSKRRNEAAKKEISVQLEKGRSGWRSRDIHKGFYERGRYLAHNRDV